MTVSECKRCINLGCGYKQQEKYTNSGDCYAYFPEKVRVRAHMDFETSEGHKWTSGKEYMMMENEGMVTLDSDTGILTCKNDIKEAVMDGFERV